MSGHSYMYRGGYSADTGGAPQKDYWSSKSYESDDHLCRPVVVDDEGKKRPIVSYAPKHHNKEGYVTKTETIVEHVHSSPPVTDYRHGSPTKVYPVKDDYSVVEERWHRTSSPVHDRPHKVEEFITKVQTDHAGRPNNSGNLGSTHWRQNHNSSGNHGNNRHGEYNGLSSNEGHKPNGKTVQNDSYDEYYHQNDSRMKPMTPSGWSKPSHATRSSSPDAPLSKATNNIDAVVGFLKEAAKPFSSTTATAAAPHSRYTESQYSEIIDSKEAAKPFSSTRTTTTTSAPHSRYTESQYSEIIDSKEAAKRYGNYNVSSRAYTVEEPYKKTIDHKEAMRKYHGTGV